MEVTPSAANASKSNSSITAVGCQISQTLGDRKANLRTMAEAVRSKPGHDLYVFPELATSGYGETVFRNLDAFAEPWQGPSYEALAEVAREQSCHLCYSFPRRREEGGFTIAAAVIDPAGDLVARYDKWHVCSTGTCCEKDFFVDGERPLEVIDIRGVRVGLCICYDIRFPELVRQLAVRENISLLLHPCGWPRDEGFHTWHPFVLTRAVENTIYVLSTNWAGEHNGCSMLCPPFVDGGEALPTKLGDDPGHLVVTVDTARLAAIRGELPYLADRNRARYAHDPDWLGGPPPNR